MPVDVERERIEKAREVTSALQEGRLPTTNQIVGGLHDAQTSNALHQNAENLSPSGKRIAVDAERILESTQTVLKQVNAHNELQNVVYYGNLSAQRRTLLNPTEANEAADRLVQAGATSANLAKIIITSPEFRTLLTDISSIAQDIVRSNVLEASDDLASDPNAPESVRNAAAQARDKVGAHSSLQGAAQDVRQQAEQKVQEQKQTVQGTQAQVQGQAQQAGQEAQEAGRQTYQTAGDSLASGATLRDTAKNIVDVVADQAESRLPEDKVNQASNAIRSEGAQLYTGEKTTGDYKQQAQAQAHGVISQAKDYANQASSQLRDPSSQVRQTGERVARKLINLPDDKRDDIVRRLKSVAKTLQSKPEFQQGIDDLIDLLAPLAYQAKDLTKTAVEKTAQAPTNPDEIQASKDSRIAISNAKQLIENIANGKSLDPLIEVIRDFASEARDDKELTTFWHDLSTYLKKTLRQPGYTEKSSFEKDASELVERGRRALEKYGDHTQNISYEAGAFAAALAANKATARLQSDTSQLINDLFLDERGKPAFKPELLADLAKVVPLIADKLAYLPIPRVEADDGTYHMIFDNIILHSTILPKYIRIVTDTTVDASKEKAIDQINNAVTIEISKIEASARDIAWLFNKHKGFFKAGDVGLADFDIKGDGLSVKIKLTPGNEAGRAAEAGADGRWLNASEVSCNVKSLDLRLHDSHHDILYKVAKPILNKTAKKQIENAIEKNLKDFIFTLDEKLAQVAQTAGANSAPEPVKGIPEWGSKAFEAKV
ncbi:uncharacterized protein EV422DRAFT_515820 [Fimicolochytrium jonesii]|uniref:uncharacterized protein n=1 Tax=Fimicolochytrium jonesii TaxID=1396493 RepID=UPI0022FF0971|nr:uncharacterized protein EV422DRAFT_515820 [Fimicolochytrium jonesii]KAI8826221.1 hypothetical protein EV422DRAFT_515820 [Fimicolochytrium jonesii]